MPSMTDDQHQQAIQLRSGGMSYLKIAAKVGASESSTFKYLSSLSKPPPKPKPTPIVKAVQLKPKARAHGLLPPHEFHHVGSCPIRRPMNSTMMEAPQLTKAQMYHDLAVAVRNTLRLAPRARVV
jgi:hypothetical protein